MVRSATYAFSRSENVRNSLQPMLDFLMHICGCTGGDREFDRSGSLRSEPDAARLGALNCYHGSTVRPRVIDDGARHSLLACGELREAARYLLFGDGDPVRCSAA